MADGGFVARHIDPDTIDMGRACRPISQWWESG
jgi:hypothetical protein